MPHTVSPNSHLPPFPDHAQLPEIHLNRLPLSKLLSGDVSTEADLFDHCQSHGFFYLDLTESERGASLLQAADRLHALSEEAFHISLEDKQAVSNGTLVKGLFGWKAPGAVAKDDVHKRKDVGEFFNVAKDDVVGNYDTGVQYPPLIKDEMPTLFHGFIQDAHATGLAALDVLARQLGISAKEMQSRHRLSEASGDHVRLTWGPGDPSATDATPSSREEKDTRITTPGHTDFGSVTLLFNWLGGLQIEDAESKEWKWVRPLPGHAICNLGDAMVEFSGGRLKSGKHRVVAAPGAQARLERYSVVYFVRPENQIIMEDLVDADKKKEGKKWTAGEWLVERARGLGVMVNGK